MTPRVSRSVLSDPVRQRWTLKPGRNQTAANLQSLNARAVADVGSTRREPAVQQKAETLGKSNRVKLAGAKQRSVNRANCRNNLLHTSANSESQGT